MSTTSEPDGPPVAAFDGDDYDDEDFGQRLPVRPRRPFLTKWSAGLMALVLGAIGFYVGIRVEKAKLPASGTGSALSSRFAGADAGTGSAGSRNASRAGGFGGAGSFGARFGAAGAGATIGSVTSVDGDTIYVKETSGNTVKVKLSKQTTIAKDESVARSKVFPGDEVVIAGASGKGGTITATSLTDSGAGSSGRSPSSSSGAGSNNASSAIGSLFGS
ncbi:MAG: hypothetical protein ACRDKL_04090 [Solirubrobacteraceae bacterium]